jgi:hypothetical protein
MTVCSKHSVGSIAVFIVVVQSKLVDCDFDCWLAIDVVMVCVIVMSRWLESREIDVLDADVKILSFTSC